MLDKVEEIRWDVWKWLEEKGYDEVIVLLKDNVLVYARDEISEEDISLFNRKFNCNLEYQGLSEVEWFKAYMSLAPYSLDENEFHKYSFFHQGVHKFNALIEEWVEEYNIECTYDNILACITVVSPEILLEAEIKAFEEKTGLKCTGWTTFENFSDVMYWFKQE